jgi:acetyl-CoA C-acetyltransferase
MAEAFIIDAARTPRGIGKAGKGGLAHLHPHHLAATVLKALRDRNNLVSADVGDVIWSVTHQRRQQSCDLGRMAALLAGFDVGVSGVTLDRFCGGGITAVSLAAAQIMAGVEDCLIGGGTEMMSLSTLFNKNEAEAGWPVLGIAAGDAALQDIHPQCGQGVAADAIASMEGFTREELDRAALLSQQRAIAAINEGRFDRSIVPVYNDDGSIALARDENPRAETTLEGLAQLKPAFGQMADSAIGFVSETHRQAINRRYPGLTIEHVHHAGNSSGVVDGAAGVLLASAAYANRVGWKPRARIVAMTNCGDDPTLMLNAPVPAARKVLAKANLAPDDIDLWEINEAFAVVSEKFIRDLKLDREKVNVNGGAIALGHPIGATGSMLIGTLLDELERRGKRLGLVTMCASGGMAPAMIIERIGD